jgi:hypothetical protein
VILRQLVPADEAGTPDTAFVWVPRAKA